jgi:hypothetical protein
MDEFVHEPPSPIEDIYHTRENKNIYHLSQISEMSISYPGYTTDRTHPRAFFLVTLSLILIWVK